MVLLRLLGDFVFPENSPAPTKALIALLGDCGFGEHAARQAINRCAQLGLIAGGRNGRSTEWALTARGLELMADGNRRARELGSDPARWDGRWLAVIISVPHDRRAIRQKLYRTLGWAGCGMPEPSLWICAHPGRAERIAADLAALDLDRAAISFVGSAGAVGLDDAELVARAWDLGLVADNYRRAVQQFDVAATPQGAELIRQLVEVDGVLQSMVSQDPWLPAELSPDRSIREHAALLVDYRERLLGSARAHWGRLLDS
ncbi:hypothetical protein ACN94_18920 [Gordonia paraffinivorans]|uniref:phenylacetic acid degradation protein PaaX n=1 Tax=Gordonia paraffinivorans TaxID=175628 RepID=UPI001C92D0F7|nr:phenylacetic acid degradation protein PaaX [Gordonia paraffinivorans]MBY4575631.1 hypothetical protein [Gordonia paraffinivorans]